MKLNDKVYDTLKWVAQILLPALGVLYVSLSEMWNLPKPLEVAGSLAAVGTFIGVVLGISAAAYKKTNDAHAGFLYQTGVDPDTGHPDLALTLTKLPTELLSKKTVTLHVDKPVTQVTPAVAPPTSE